jgi:hypothetical protein
MTGPGGSRSSSAEIHGVPRESVVGKREYHSLVLETGTVPLDLLEREVDRWIRAKGGKI